LGSLSDFDELVKAAKGKSIDIALDIAFQTSPDHPTSPSTRSGSARARRHYPVRPKTRRRSTRTSIRSSSRQGLAGLYDELKSVFEFWLGHGVKIFRVDNPHTKPFAFWGWAIGELKRQHPELIFLSEAFTRPRIMHRLAKLGFTQSYTYFTWRNTKQELIEYFTELSRILRASISDRTYGPIRRTSCTSSCRRAAGRRSSRASCSAATLAANYGLYGPAYELMEHTPREPAARNTSTQEKYEIKRWEIDRADSLSSIIKKLNRIRKEIQRCNPTGACASTRSTTMN